MRVGMFQGDEVTGDVARLLDAQAQAGHDGGLLHDELMAIIGAAGMCKIKDERHAVFGIVFGAKIALLERTVGARAFARVVHPAHQVIVIVLFAHAAEVRGERAAHDVGAFADGMAAEAAA